MRNPGESVWVSDLDRQALGPTLGLVLALQESVVELKYKSVGLQQETVLCRLSGKAAAKVTAAAASGQDIRR